MKIRIWGCRGSITTPGPDTLRYGGHTTCVEVRTADGQLIIIDAGSGLVDLGRRLARARSPHQITFLFTHGHWDHLNGFPFFAPAYQARFHIRFCGGPDAQASIRSYMTHQMRPPFFPVEFAHLQAQFTFGCECGRTRCHNRIPGIHSHFHCQAMALNHPNGGHGFKFTENGRSFIFLTDNELGFSHPGGPTRDEFVQYCAGADLLLHDAQYQDQEYRITRGWGHSTFADAVGLAIDAKVKRLGLIHHDPDRSDDDLDEQVETCREQIAHARAKLKCFAVAEGMTFRL